MGNEEKAIMERAKQISLERELRKEKHLVICKIADEVYEKCLHQNLNCEDVEELCRLLLTRAKRCPIC
ncbi:hypothetical protein [Anaerotignum propionicum]|uniref:Uncharacterized protein n=1 Tax=Anaerotignum propionicum DSM 1682 TaxID=991789 RepID=A0A0X8VDM5_ANAPI|nr:hypothetical protein [Anaerotignum propionicum]AMJ42011.1 hypothetical protein CPRO_24450 [Anaerotignum propionicum DSM 1682]SHF02920.1 hypothetical protein SAMN02745151_02547 [[Clostridium] propionicum DSM 1682] [Anaerotignum propionicum DSM 1682]